MTATNDPIATLSAKVCIDTPPSRAGVAIAVNLDDNYYRDAAAQQKRLKIVAINTTKMPQLRIADIRPPQEIRLKATGAQDGRYQ